MSTRAIPTRRDRAKADRRRRLFECAMRLYVEHGYDAVTVEQIAAAADVAKGTFFNYFPTKAHVLLQYHAGVVEELLAAGEAVTGAGSRAMFKRFLRTMADVAVRDGPMFDLLVRQVFTQPELAARDQRTGPRMIDLYARFLRVGVASGELRPDLDLRLVPLVIGDLWTGTILEWSFGGRPFALRRRLDRKLDLLFDGLCRRDGRAR